MWKPSPRIDGADRLLVEVQGDADGAVLELEELVDADVGQAGDAGDAVADLEDAADLADADTSALKPSRFFLRAAAMSLGLMERSVTHVRPSRFA